MLNPDTDEVIRAIALYLREHLNSKAEEYYTAEELPILVVVRSVADHQTDLKTATDFPALMVYRTSFSGELAEECSANIDYFLPISVKTRTQQSARFNWVARQIAIALAEYTDTGDRCVEIQGNGGYSATTRFAEVQGNGGFITIPFLRGTFTFTDLEPV
ncbi:MAG: hypothetical protein AAF215_33585 [Cyanobacteria bacterium P01_A01_bin.123]